MKDLSETELLQRLAACRDGSDDQPCQNELARLIHELQAHALELESQNRELRLTQEALKQSRDRYAELYEAAPIGYLNLDSQGVIRDINRAGATLLGRERVHLVGSPLLPWVAPEDQSKFLAHLQDCRQQGQAVAELTLLTPAGTRLAVQLASQETRGHENGRIRYLTALTELTERKRADALRRQWAAIVESSDDAILGKTLEGIITSWNAGAERLFGYTADEAIGRPMTFIIPPERQAEEREILRRIGQGQRIEHYETERLGKDGRRIAVSLTVSPFQDEQGRVIGASTIARDITERKAAERQLKEREAFANKVLMSSLNGLYIYDVKAGSDVFINAQCTQLTGYTLEDLQALAGSAFFALFHPDDQGRIIAHFKALLDTVNGETLEIEYRFKTADGRWIWCVSRDAVFAREADGTVRQIIGTFLDITERKQAEHALAAERSLLDTLHMAAPVGLAFLDPQLRYVRVNEALAEMHGLPVADHLGRSLQEIVPELWPAVESLYRSVLERGEPVTQVDVTGETKAQPGVRRHWLANYYPVRVDREIIGIGVIVQDITERQQAEEALREADRRKDEFLAMLGHELRNPLMPIRNAVQIMHKLGMADPKLIWVRDLIDRQVTHLVRLVDDLLDVSRISRGKIELKKEPLTLADIVQRAVETSRPLIEARRHRFSVHLPPEPVHVEGDLIRLAQTVSNLLNNAAKYTPEGGRIWLKATREPEEVVISVRDTGEGIPSTLLPHLFKAFTQAERTLDRAQGGLGLGLTIVKRIVELHGGQIEARSEGIGKGSEFIVRLPVCEP
ncbi:PAS domain S-box protein [Methylocaldum sp.]|uniref:PAS domain S-box protein n=1 Tax=Methylocaldum sp. TaxID=1969727 RepID=UPI002D24309B|nr:PAS domain S-box protein [Methylocaldum sp.]HYE37525.1 PAS domain S-box protein [Methylocaldum sp.]